MQLACMATPGLFPKGTCRGEGEPREVTKAYRQSGPTAIWRVVVKETQESRETFGGGEWEPIERDDKKVADKVDQWHSYMTSKLLFFFERTRYPLLPTVFAFQAKFRRMAPGWII